MTLEGAVRAVVNDRITQSERKPEQFRYLTCSRTKCLLVTAGVCVEGESFMFQSINGAPVLIQGGMGAAVSGWELARAVSLTGQLGVVSGTAIEHIEPTT